MKKFLRGQVKSINPDQKTVTVIMSSGSIDREGESLDPNGWDFTNFQNNPVLLWSHDAYALPIGKVSRVWVENGLVLGETEFAEAESEFAAEVARLVRGGYINTVSVGFLPLEVDNMGRVIKQELLELSYVNVPANQDAQVVERTGDKNAALKLKSFAELEKKALQSARQKQEGGDQMNYPAELAKFAAAISEMCGQISGVEGDANALRGLLDQMMQQLSSMADCIWNWQDELGYQTDAKALAALKEKVGRVLSETNRNQIRLMVDACKQAADAGAKLLDSTEPPDKKGDIPNRKAAQGDPQLRALRIADRAVEILIQGRKEALVAEQNGGEKT